MKQFYLNKFVFVAIALALPIMVSAQATRTWVSGVGDDVNPCSRTAPCKTFAGAISKTAVGGEINCIDPGGFGAVTITKSIVIDCTGTFGSILASGTNGVVINITSATDTRKAVKLRGLSINGASTGLNGVRILAANAVNVEDSVIDGFTTHGISIETTAGTPKIVVRNTTIRSAVGNGINSFITGGTVNLAISDSQISNTATGVNISGNTKVVIRSSTVASNTTGILAASAEVGVESCSVSGNGTGISALAAGNLILSGNMIAENTTGLAASGGGTIVSFGNNAILGNATNGAPTSVVALK
jgi:hypothetical protein